MISVGGISIHAAPNKGRPVSKRNDFSLDDQVSMSAETRNYDSAVGAGVRTISTLDISIGEVDVTAHFSDPEKLKAVCEKFGIDYKDKREVE